MTGSADRSQLEVSRLKAISFDGDDTLWDFQKVMRHSLTITLDELRQRLPVPSASLTVDRMIEIREEVGAEHRGRTTNLEEVRFQAFRRTLEHIGCPDDSLARDLNRLYLKHRFADIELYPDVIPTLDDLRSHFTIGLLSNGNSYPERCGLAERFGFVVFSQEVGVEKPDPRIFHFACEQAGCTPSELLHVGNSLETDVAGANAVDAVSVWLNRSGAVNDADIVPDFEIRSLAELPEIANRLA